MTKCDSFVITKYDRVYLKFREVLQSAMIIRNWDSTGAMFIFYELGSHTYSSGTFAGTTALSIALALPEDGQMVTIDFKDDWVATGRPMWTKVSFCCYS